MPVTPGYVWAVTRSCQEGIAFVRLYAAHGTFDRRVVPCYPFVLMDLWWHGDSRECTGAALAVMFRLGGLRGLDRPSTSLAVLSLLGWVLDHD